MLQKRPIELMQQNGASQGTVIRITTADNQNKVYLKAPPSEVHEGE